MALLLQTLVQPFVFLKYSTSFKVAFIVQIWKRILSFKNLFRKIERKILQATLIQKIETRILQATLIQNC